MEAKQSSLQAPTNQDRFQEWSKTQKEKREMETNNQGREPSRPDAPEVIVEKELSRQDAIEARALEVQRQRMPAEKEEMALMSAEDEKQIVLAALGSGVEELVYCYRKKTGKWIAGVTPAGARDLARRIGDIELLIPVSCNVEEGPDGKTYWHAAIRAKHYDVILTGFGRHPCKMKLKSGQIIEDEMAWNTALGKATRNALLAVLPEATIKGYIDEHLPEILEKKGFPKSAAAALRIERKT